MIIHSPIISGSLTFSEGSTLTLPPSSVYSGSFSGSYQGDTFTGGTFVGDGSSLTFGGTGIVSGSSQVEFNDVNNNPFSQSASSVTVSKSIIPNSLTLDLGSAANPFKDLYLSSASLYIDGTQVISTQTGDLNITTDANQSLRIVEEGADTITVQSENGDITLVATGNGNIELNAPIQIVAGNQILSSDGNAIQFGEDIDITGNITVSGTVDGIDLQAFSGSVASDFDGLSTDYNDLENIPVGIVSGSSQVNADTITNFDTNVKEKLDADGVVSGSSQISADQTDGWSADVKTQLNSNTVISGSSQVNADSITNFDSNVLTYNNSLGVVSGSSQVVLEDADKTGFVGANSITTLGTVTSGNVDAILPIGVISGSNQLPAGVISGSSQVQAGEITGDIALGTQTSGNYVATLGTLTGLSTTGNTGEGSTPTLSVSYGSIANTAVQGDTSVSFTGTTNEITIDGGSSITLGSGGTVTIGLADSIAGDRTFSNNVTITGNLIVNGTTTTVNSNTVNIGDNVLVLNSDETGTPSQNGGIEIERGNSTNSTLLWDESNDYWVAGLAGSEERIVIGAGNTDITTLGTITTGTWNGTSISTTYTDAKVTSIVAGTGISVSGGTGDVTVTNSDRGSSQNIFKNFAVSGQTTVVADSNDDTLTLAAGSNVTITTNAGTDTITIESTDTNTTYSAGTGVTLTDTTFSIGQAVGTGDDVTFGSVRVDDATASTTKTTGALIVDGGVGIAGALNVGGDVVAYASSDERLKDNIELISNPIEKVQSLKGVTWNWNENADELQQSLPNVGVIAQDVEKVLPQLVTDRDNGFKGVDYAKLTGLLIEAIKEQQKQIDELKSKIQ